MIKHKQLKANPAVSNMIGPPPMWLGNNVLISQGPPKPINMSKVFAPNALLTVIDPIPANNKPSTYPIRISYHVRLSKVWKGHSFFISNFFEPFSF